jgi:hypothetical protein
LPKSAEVGVILRCSVTTQLFDSEQDLRYFRIFCQETAHQISGPFNTGLWNRLMPQASEAVPFVRHAIIAVAALSKITGEADHTLMIRGEGEESSRLRLEHQYALQQYEKALKGMRRSIENGEHDLRNAMLACLLSFSIESLQGRQSPACILASSGVALFHEWIGENPAGLTTCSSPNEHVIENDLVQAFAGLDIHVAFFLDTRPLELHQRVIDDTALILLSMPSSFRTLCEARTYW